MPSLNRVFLIGRITGDPELRYTPQGVAVCDLRLAVNRTWTGHDGSKKEETCFIDIVAWRKTAEVCAEYLRKGSPLFVDGHLQMDSWEAPDKQKRSRLRVVAENVQFIGDRPQRAHPGPSAGPPLPEEPPDNW